MKRKIKTAALALSFALMSMIFVFGGCTRYANQEDLQTLENQQQAALSAEQRVQERERQKGDLQREVDQKENELSDKEERLKDIKGK